MSDFTGKSHSGTEAIAFGARALNSELFRELFREGMALVEETASYLDGDGRIESRNLSRAATLSYSTESMRLTTRLMQIASWLLLHRAVKEGEMSLAQANKEKTKVKLSVGEPADADIVAMLPERLRDLIARSRSLHEQVRRLDATIHAPLPDEPRAGNPLEHQLGLLKAAFERNEG